MEVKFPEHTTHPQLIGYKMGYLAYVPHKRDLGLLIDMLIELEESIATDE